MRKWQYIAVTCILFVVSCRTAKFDPSNFGPEELCKLKPEEVEGAIQAIHEEWEKGALTDEEIQTCITKLSALHYPISTEELLERTGLTRLHLAGYYDYDDTSDPPFILNTHLGFHQDYILEYRTKQGDEDTVYDFRIIKRSEEERLQPSASDYQCPAGALTSEP